MRNKLLRMENHHLLGSRFRGSKNSAWTVSSYNYFNLFATLDVLFVNVSTLLELFFILRKVKHVILNLILKIHKNIRAAVGLAKHGKIIGSGFSQLPAAKLVSVLCTAEKINAFWNYPL